MENIKKRLSEKQLTWFLTGAAGFIGSNLLEFLLVNNQKVIAVDNFLTGRQSNLDDVISLVGENKKNLTFLNLDIKDYQALKDAMTGCDYVLHQAALGSVPRSINNPLASNENNVTGTLNVFYAAVENNIKRIVYASSSSVYGDHPDLPKEEDKIGKVLSPYAATKKVCEIYADVFSKTYDIELIGLRYFNVFGRRQDPNGAYAAVIPKWTSALLANQEVFINGDGQTSRDFTYIENIIQLNIKAAMTKELPKKNMVFNGAFGKRITLNQLYTTLKNELSLESSQPTYKDFRNGDVRHSLANIDLAKKVLGYDPKFDVYEGLKQSINWYRENSN